MFEKGSKEQKFFIDWWQVVKKYGAMVNSEGRKVYTDDAFWHGLISESNKVSESNGDNEFTTAIVLAGIDYFEKDYKDHKPKNSMDKR